MVADAGLAAACSENTQTQLHYKSYTPQCYTVIEKEDHARIKTTLASALGSLNSEFPLYLPSLSLAGAGSGYPVSLQQGHRGESIERFLER